MKTLHIPTTFALCALLLAATHGVASAQLRLGVVGGSYHDENRGVMDFPSVGWNEQLVEAGIVDMGDYEPDPTVRWEPRYDGYSYNWARGGASAMSPTFRDLFPNDPRFRDLVPFSVQIEGLSQQIAAGEIDLVSIGVGGNDLTIYSILGGPLSGPIFEDFTARLVDAIFEAVAAFQQAGDVPIVLMEIPVVPDGLPQRAAASAAVNAAIHTRAAQQGVAVMNPFGFLDDRFRTNGDGEVRVGPHWIPSASVASPTALVPPDSEDATGPCQLFSGLCSTREYNLSFLLHDALHPTTVTHGLIANQFITTVRRAHHIALRPLTDREILSAAGLTTHGW